MAGFIFTGLDELSAIYLSILNISSVTVFDSRSYNILCFSINWSISE